MNIFISRIFHSFPNKLIGGPSDKKTTPVTYFTDNNLLNFS